MDTIFKYAFTNLDGYSIAHTNKNMPKVLQMAASKRKHTGSSPEKNTILEEHKCGTALPGSDDQMKLFSNQLKHPRSEKSMTEKNHETAQQIPQSGGSSSLQCNQVFQRDQAFQCIQKHASNKANVYAVSDHSDGTLPHSQRADFQHSSAGQSKLYSRRSSTEVKSSRNKSNGHTSKRSFRIIDKLGTAICILSCISDIQNLEEMIEYKACGLDDETIWYLTSKVKLKIRRTINYIKTRG